LKEAKSARLFSRLLIKSFITRALTKGEDEPLGSSPISSLIMEREYAEYLLNKTRQNYNITAKDYARTRAFIPEDIKALGEYTKEKDRVLDSGCANGRLFEILANKNADFYGVDFSEELIKLAGEKYPQGKFQTADALQLPFPENYFDNVYSISVLHNIPSRDFQLQYLKEARRVLKSEGLLILRVWDFWRRKEGWKLFLKHSFLKMVGKSKMDFYDVLVPWKDSVGKPLVQRYFHCFTKREIKNLIKDAGFKIKESWRAGKDPRTNIYIIAEK